MKHIVLSVVICAAVGGCSLVPKGLKKSPSVDGTVVVMPSGEAVGDQTRPQARPGDAPVVSAPEAVVPKAASGSLGSTVVSLGSPAETGLWLKTPLVAAQSSGKVTYNGKTIDVTLIPIEGAKTAGSRLSLQGFQALGASLTDLVEVQVSA